MFSMKSNMYNITLLPGFSLNSLYVYIYYWYLISVFCFFTLLPLLIFRFLFYNDWLTY
ncbi:uncharacterized protein BX663DRAFT_495047 [Cokeromyces recurvatus]|uniref:uncharacterized protein n=1 Tax=Cokeromyces recurvatus TaxID=90255 RepID=UPI00221F1091|nr:uncharacterized protein BX663DRAFT_495047 [Cokeromyces recurvatus]KAI7907167.1 hypothetical protein BX663DRAFT_495047 [Cokeromyces recurvatus]